MADDSPQATGVLDALIADILLGLDIKDPLALTRDQRLAEIKRAAADGRIKPESATRLRVLGVLPTE